MNPPQKSVDIFYIDTSKHVKESFKTLRNIRGDNMKAAKPVKHMDKHVPVFATNMTKVALHFHYTVSFYI